MTYESQRACERIVALCEKSDNPTDRQVRIYDIALQGLGLVQRQRDEIISPWRQALIQARRDRHQAKWEAEQAEAQNALRVA